MIIPCLFSLSPTPCPPTDLNLPFIFIYKAEACYSLLAVFQINAPNNTDLRLQPRDQGDRGQQSRDQTMPQRWNLNCLHWAAPSV